MESISAFSNTKGGTILIEIQDNGMISGVDTGTRTLEDLTNYVKRNTDPPIFPSIEQYQNQGKNVIAIVVNLLNPNLYAIVQIKGINTNKTIN